MVLTPLEGRHVERLGSPGGPKQALHDQCCQDRIDGDWSNALRPAEHQPNMMGDPVVSKRDRAHIGERLPVKVD